ncbi:FAD-binding domain-containing protein [Gigaspora margarita]|uniref:FAD-binding domain-containing protein n=1 Tax=Gigaspora margarita TaxID=4874 RepID=A0A8H3XAE9_GIGMA|nr:FAD-binding domain-containing protein [Gigaspora margarita]
MKLIKQIDIVSLLFWSILSLNFIENINSSPILPSFSCLDSIEGPVIYPNDTLFQSLIIDQNIRVNYTPSVLVYAVDNKDVQKAVKCAVELKRDIVPRSGGHSYEKYGLGGRDNVIVLDLTFINGITIDSNSKTAKIGAGNRLGEVYNQLNQAGFLMPAGLCPSVGIGGHVLGGGFGYYSRKYGLACDNIISMEMVDANGNILQVDSTLNPDLFFALRGAGG